MVPIVDKEISHFIIHKIHNLSAFLAIKNLALLEAAKFSGVPD